MTAPRDYDLFIDGELFVIRWRKPNPSAALAITARLEQHHEQLKGQLLVVLLIGADCSSPDKETREVLLNHHDRIYARTHTVRCVIMGQGLRQTVLRGVVTGMVLVAGLRGQPFTVDKTVEDLARVVGERLDRDPYQLLRAMVRGGIIDAEDAGLSPSA